MERRTSASSPRRASTRPTISRSKRFALWLSTDAFARERGAKPAADGASGLDGHRHLRSAGSFGLHVYFWIRFMLISAAVRRLRSCRQAPDGILSLLASPLFLSLCVRSPSTVNTYETPAAMEQPTNIVTRPLSMDEPDDRIRMVFGLTSDDPLPKPDEQTQQNFFDYLKAHLSFPFKADIALRRPLARSRGAGLRLSALLIHRWIKMQASCARPVMGRTNFKSLGGPSSQ